MFTGIVETIGEVLSLREATPGTFRFEIRTFLAPELKIGDSLSNNGCCLTVVSKAADSVGFDLLAETVNRTNLRDLKPGDLVNLERSMPANGRFDGHIVQGHVDSTARILKIEEHGQDHRIEIELPEAFRQYVVFKGSIALDGISLTVAELTDESFVVWIIPHTWSVTNLHRLRAGSRLNLEFDLVAKYIERQLKVGSGSRRTSKGL
jgi:riboflavin synthase